jgi:hypothetical protein
MQSNPAASSPTIHGGGMVMGTPEMNDAPNRYLAQQAHKRLQRMAAA